MNQQVFKGKKKAAVGGFKLLKKKVRQKLNTMMNFPDILSIFHPFSHPPPTLTPLPDPCASTYLQADARKAKFRDYAKAIAETKGTMADDTKDAFFSLTQAEYAAGDFKKAVLEGNMVAQVRVTSAVDNVAGVKLPVFNLQDTGAVSDNQTLGLVGGGKKVRGGRKGESRVVVNGEQRN